ncbi:SRPBCC domain-containing protein [Marinicauda algicola]|uniref:SRPBCC domain-containing protein n=1 Tax=Marinicauda algicola TaxID=2029849 RepID=A0A4S2H3J6_9PROT|nr:SRPBCC domain-containing protein [Marinicauda algicola]TGY90146.1 SRPBCC domain-containing protein [Marinicauda algicola]
MVGSVALILVTMALAGSDVGNPAPFEVQGFRSQIDVEIAAPVETVFDAATGDVTGWWDHSFAEDPAEMVIEPLFGGRFYERFSQDGADGALHATVIYVNAPSQLRLDGPLGLSGRAVDLVTTWTLQPSEAGTLFTVDLSMAGEIDPPLAEAVTRVWDHFIRERLKPYVESGCHLAPDEPCEVFVE